MIYTIEASPLVKTEPPTEESNGSGTMDDPFIITANGSFTADVVAMGYVYYQYTATADGTFTLNFTGDDYYLEWGTFNFNLCTRQLENPASITLTAGQTVYLPISTWSDEAGSYSVTLIFTEA